MRQAKRSGSFLACLVVNLLLNFEWSIPAWILLVLHFIFDISIWWFVGAFALWLFIMIAWMNVIGWAADCSSAPDPQKENKNPYSVKSTKGDKK